MTTPVPERRRTPRVDVLPSEYIRMDVRHRVRLLDISLTGALMACSVKLPVGTRGEFRVALATEPFVAAVVVGRHHTPSAHHRDAGLGAIFASMDQRSRQQLHQFLREGSQ